MFVLTDPWQLTDWSFTSKHTRLYCYFSDLSYLSHGMDSSLRLLLLWTYFRMIGKINFVFKILQGVVFAHLKPKNYNLWTSFFKWYLSIWNWERKGNALNQNSRVVMLQISFSVLCHGIHDGPLHSKYSCTSLHKIARSDRTWLITKNSMLSVLIKQYHKHK